LTRSTYLSDSGPCTSLPVYKCPVFRQSSPKLDLILNINILESPPCASPFPQLLHNPLRVVSSNTRDFYSFKVLATSSLLVQVILSRPVEALTLGIAIERNADTISLSQTTFIDHIIEQFGQTDAHPVDTPMVVGLQLCHPDKSIPIPSEVAKWRECTLYCKLGGSLNYIAVAM